MAVNLLEINPVSLTKIVLFLSYGVLFTPPAAGIEPGSPQGGGAWPAWRGGDFRSPRKPAGAAPGNRGLPVKARSRPQNTPACLHTDRRLNQTSKAKTAAS